MTSDANTNLWTDSAGERVDTRPLARDLDADLVIVGGGFTGCSAALEAARSGASVVLLEANSIAHGGSGRNVGLVNAGLWLPPDDVLQRMGQSAGMRLLELLGQGPQHVFDIIEREGIDCEATHAGTLHLAHSASGLDDLRERHRQGNRTGAPLQLLDAAETERRTGSALYRGALFDPRAGTIQPLAYCCGLARAAEAAGAQIHGGSPVTAVVREGDRWRVAANGHTVCGPALLVATNAYHLGFAGLADPAFSTVHFSQFATQPLPQAMRNRILPGGEGCWDTALVMSSIRMDRSGRLILGGMGNARGPGARIHRAWAHRKLRGIFPEIGEIGFSHQWQGRIAMTADHIPKVIGFGPRAYSVFGYSGRGIAPGTVFGTAAARALLEDRPEALPVPVQDSYGERFTTAKSAYYEIGATLAHAVSATPLLN